MTVAGDLRTVLLTFSTVTDLVGTGNAARIRPEKLQQDDDETEEAIIIEIDNIAHTNRIDGLGGRIYADVTLRCRGVTQALAEALAEAVRVNGTDPGTGLAGYDGTVNGHEFDAVLDEEQVVMALTEDGRDSGYYDVMASYVVTIAETT
jgi:hypothetical protein